VKCVALLGGALLAGLAYAQPYPAKPVRVISGQNLGSSGDISLRLISPRIGEKLGQTLVVENRTGASGAIAASAVSAAAPDGYTILSVGAGTMVTNVFLVKNLSFNSVKDFVPITQYSRAVTFVTIPASLPPGSMAELIEYARRRPGKLSFGSTGMGSPFHLIGESLKMATGIDIVHIPYSGGNAALAQNDLLTGRLDIYFPSYTNLRQHIGGGKVKLLAVTDTVRFSRLPEVPAVSDAVPGYRHVPSWNGFFGPAGMPQAIVGRLNTVILETLKEPEIVTRMEDLGLTPVRNGPEAFAKVIAAELESFGEFARKLGIKPE
jgi:tripartite-type tricarboxylate transporter receptor subunit TctC